MKNKLFFGLASATVVALPVAAVVSCGSSNKPTFYNYEDYMADEIIDQVNGDFSYSTFGDLPEFESLIRQKKTAGGIGSDYLNATLAKEGLIQKIDFGKVFPSCAGKTGAALETELQKIYTPETWQLMAGFDAYIGNGNHLYEFMIPYFIQDKAIAFDLDESMKGATTGKHWSEDEYNKLISGVNAEIMSVFESDQDTTKLTYSEIFKTLKAHGYQHLIVNDYWRDNLMMGSEKTGFTSTVTKANYQSQIDGFKSLLNDFTGNNDNGVLFKTSGGETLEQLILPTANIDVATLYNGDALDAYYGEDNGASDGTIGVVKATNSSYLLDGMIIPSYVSGGDLDNLYKVARDYLFEGADSTDASLTATKIYENFDFVNYTTPFKNLFASLQTGGSDDYFDGDKLAEYISIGMIQGTVDSAHVTQPIDKQLQDEALNAYKQAFTNSEQ